MPKYDERSKITATGYTLYGTFPTASDPTKSTNAEIAFNIEWSIQSDKKHLIKLQASLTAIESELKTALHRSKQLESEIIELKSKASATLCNNSNTIAEAVCQCYNKKSDVDFEVDKIIRDQNKLSQSIKVVNDRIKASIERINANQTTPDLYKTFQRF